MASLTELFTSGNIVKLSNGSFPICRAIWSGAAGTATMTSESNQTLTSFPLQAGINPIKVKAITLGTATDVWAMY